MFNEDTIAAVSTPIGYGGISIIRISGKNAFAICDKLFVRPNGKTFLQQVSGNICYGHIVGDSGEILDEVLVSKMKAPYTFTAEDVAEINCHGGMAAVKSVLDAVIAKGARTAEPGEFTKRAFLNGRIDLMQAEAVSDIILSKTALSAKAALSQLSGVLSDEINGIKKVILSLLADLEVTIQYPEYDVPEVTDSALAASLVIIREKLDALLDTYKKGEILKEGLKIVIAGKPNVGKSMLLNRLINKNKAIVTDIPGTTRDVVDEYINLNGVPVIIMDTAGIRESTDTVENIGIRKSLDTIRQADVVLFVVDGSQMLTEEDKNILDAMGDTQMIVVLNKADAGILKETADKFESYDKVVISALTKEGLADLENKLTSFASQQGEDIANTAMITNARHKALLQSALEGINTAIGNVENGMPVDFLETDIRESWETLGKITGETVSEEIIDEIFANFCLGK